jgi:peptidoglycan hydrolase CwlO-like protein
MIWISLAAIVIVTELIIFDVYKMRFENKQDTKNESLDSLEERMQALEDQVSSLRVAQGMRRRDG